MLRLSEATGVQRLSIARFLNETQSLRLDCADKLARHFGLQLMPSMTAERKGKTIEVQIVRTNEANEAKPTHRYIEVNVVPQNQQEKPPGHLTIEVESRKPPKRKGK